MCHKILLIEPLKSRTSDLTKGLGVFESLHRKNFNLYAAQEESFIEIFHNTCALMREVQEAKNPYLPEMVDAANKILNEAISSPVTITLHDNLRTGPNLIVLFFRRVPCDFERSQHDLVRAVRDGRSILKLLDLEAKANVIEFHVPAHVVPVSDLTHGGEAGECVSGRSALGRARPRLGGASGTDTGGDDVQYRNSWIALLHFAWRVRLRLDQVKLEFGCTGGETVHDARDVCTAHGKRRCTSNSLVVLVLDDRGYCGVDDTHVLERCGHSQVGRT
jgi:hypothetical protein